MTISCPTTSAISCPDFDFVAYSDSTSDLTGSFRHILAQLSENLPELASS